MIVELVDGYDSTCSLSVILRNVLFVWVVAGVVLIATGFSSFRADGATNDGLESIRIANAARDGLGLLLILTAILAIVWVTRTHTNVKHLDKNPSIGLWHRIKIHLFAFVLGGATLAGSLLAPDLAVVLVAATIALWLYAQMWLHFVMFDTVGMLWRTSAPVAAEEDEPPSYVLVWFVSWLVFVGILVATQATSQTVSVDAQLSMAQGLACISAGIFGGRLVTAISRRQDERVSAIINDFDGDRTQAPVTSNQIFDAWSASEGLIELPGRY